MAKKPRRGATSNKPSASRRIKASLTGVELTHSAALFDNLPVLGGDRTLRAEQPLTMEQLGQDFGFVHYRTTLPAAGSLKLNGAAVTAGQVVSAVALLKHNPKPTVDEARLAMSGNLCRCGAYDHYLRAVMRASREA